MSSPEPLYLGLDLSTQQLKAILITSSLKVVSSAKVDFDADLPHYGVTKGVHIKATESEVYAPVAMWIEALDLVLSRLKDAGAPLQRVKGVSGAGQQHGSVFWSFKAEALLAGLDVAKSLVEQLSPGAFTHVWSPNWQDASTQGECDIFDDVLGSEEELAKVTGSKAHHRFTGPQIMKLREKLPEVYKNTKRISLVSSFLASLFLGKFAPLDISDVCGMNLWDMRSQAWSEPLLKLASGESGLELKSKLGEVRKDGGGSMGAISKYFVERYGFAKDCQIVPFTGDNPSTILALPLRPMDAIVSLGTSTTFLMSTPKYVPDSSYHFFNHPTTDGLYMFMLCYKNGGLARERIRDSLPKPENEDPWAVFDRVVSSTSPLGRPSPKDAAKLGLYFPLPEIVPNSKAGTWRFNYDSTGLKESLSKWKPAGADARAIVESQVMSLRLRSQNLVISPADGIPPQPRRIYLVGGGSLSPAIARVIGEVLGGAEGVYKLDVGGNSCALGGAYKAVWAIERQKGESFEELIGGRWQESEAVVKVDKGYREDIWEVYGDILPTFEQMEQVVMRGRIGHN